MDKEKVIQVVDLGIVLALFSLIFYSVYALYQGDSQSGVSGLVLGVVSMVVVLLVATRENRINGGGWK